MKFFIKFYITCLIFLTIFSFANASEITFEKLDEVIDSSSIIFKAKITNINHYEENGNLFIIADIPPYTPLQHINIYFSAALKGIKHKRIIPIIKDHKGNIVGGFSPIIKASGIEFNLKNKEEYIFFAESNPEMENGYMHVFRIENIDKELIIKKILKEKQNRMLDSKN